MAHPYAFTRTIQKADQTRRFTIRSTDRGWELREEQGSRIVRQRRYRDWHHVELARRRLTEELNALETEGWSEA